MKFGTTQTSPIDSGSNRNNASRKLGSSFQNAHSTSAKIFRRRISAACASVGALESGFTVEPCPTIKRALCSMEFMRPQKTSNVCATFARLRGGKLFATIQLLERGVLCTREPPFPIRKSLPLRRERGDPVFTEATARRRRIDYLGASEATIFSKRGSPRSGSQNGNSFSEP